MQDWLGTEDDTLALEGIERSLESLETLLQENLGEEKDILICMDCWSPQDSCRCIVRKRVVFWPLRQAIYNLRMKLGLSLW